MVYLSRDSQFIQIQIHNQGKVSDEIFASFFDKYATFGKSGGTGLGTYSAKLFTQIHGGQLEMDSSDSTGTTLTVRLPAGPLRDSRIHIEVAIGIGSGSKIMNIPIPIAKLK